MIYKQKYYNELEIATTEDYNKYQQYFTDLQREITYSYLQYPFFIFILILFYISKEDIL